MKNFHSLYPKYLKLMMIEPQLPEKWYIIRWFLICGVFHIDIIPLIREYHMDKIEFNLVVGC